MKFTSAILTATLLAFVHANPLEARNGVTTTSSSKTSTPTATSTTVAAGYGNYGNCGNYGKYGNYNAYARAIEEAIAAVVANAAE